MPSDAAGGELLPKRIALPVFAADALSSVAYAPDEILLTLSLAGAMALVNSFWVGLAVTVVLFVVVMSYRQTVHAYPSGGGDYEVVTTNLGPRWGLLVASALLVDYILTVAVSISAGAQYVTTAFPLLAGWEVPLAVCLVALLALLNLRGTRESGVAFAIPTYVYMGAIGVMIVWGLIKYVTGTLGQAPTAIYEVVPHSQYADGLIGLGGAFLLMRAFSSGCAALTGVEAISNGVPSFRRPKSRNAAATLAMLGGISASMMLSILLLARATGTKVVDDPQTQLRLNGQPVPEDLNVGPAISQIAQAVFGPTSFFFLLVTIVTGLILVLAANTAFNGFPSLTSVLSRDSFLPRQLHTRGDRLVYSNGIIVLGAGAVILIVAFDAEVTRLIQLYVVGVFVSFTLSQLGMIRHWNTLLRTRQDGLARTKVLRSRAVNIVGFMATGIVLGVVLVTKFAHGAWITLVLIALAYLMQNAIYSHYQMIAADLRVEDWTTKRALPSRVRALVLVSGFTKPAMRAIAAARASEPTSIEVVSVITQRHDENKLRTQWERSGVPVPLTLLAAPYRDVTGVIVQHISALRASSPSEMLIVYLPQYLVRHWWEHILHNHMAAILNRELLKIPGVIVTVVPWKLGDDEAVEGRRPSGGAPGQTKNEDM
ncbi:APC family permease [Schaalia suimastitidis]|uniref:APC family permease n=1 Tax=Schaalia suimastitidis TaxID=121163 RepID=UPI0004174D76|nr:APC family permease [Schaalia suimastitidis]